MVIPRACNKILVARPDPDLYTALLRKARICSRLSFGSFLGVAFEVPVFVWLIVTFSRPFKENCRALRLSTPPSSRRSMAWCPWLCARSLCLKLLNTSDLTRSKALVVVTFPVSLSARTFTLTPVCAFDKKCLGLALFCFWSGTKERRQFAGILEQWIKTGPVESLRDLV